MGIVITWIQKRANCDEHESIKGCLYPICSFHILPPKFCALLVHNTGHLWTKIVYDDLHMVMMGKYPGANANPISIALEQVGSVSSPYIRIPQCRLFVVLACTCNHNGNMAASSSGVA